MYLSPLQAQRSCATEDAIRNKILQYPFLQQQHDAMEQRLVKAIALKKQQAILLKGASEPVVNVPVVVHIVLSNPAQVTDAQVASQIQVLNEDYTGANPDTSSVPAAWKQLIGNSAINFCLAQRTPDGDPTNGIVRVTSNHAPFDAGVNAAYEVKYSATGGSDAWDPDRYLNIWVCNLGNSYLGVATPPDNTFPAAEQGVVILYTGFGTTGSAASPFNRGRTATHEIGHYFGLRHIWGDDDGDGSTSRCTVDDGIDDTPLQGKRTYGCPSFPQTDNCTSTAPGFMFMNYMDYTDDACMHLFTTEQSIRMRYVLDNIRTTLLTSDGCTPVNLKNNDAAVATVNAPLGQICGAGFTPRVVLKNKGAQTLTNVRISYQVDGGAPQTFNWTGSLTALKEETVQLPAGTAGTGNHIITAYTSLPNGVTDEAPENDTAAASFRYFAPASLPLSEGFESATFPPANGWDIWNPDGGFTWELTRDAAKSGSQSAVMRNLGYATNGAIDDLYSPVINAQGYDSVFLLFDVAAAVQTSLNAVNNPWDSLQVLVTVDCGQTLDSVYGKWGPNLVTRPTPTAAEFVPAATEWRKDSVNLTPYIRFGQFRVVFRNISNYENNIYLDNINIVTKTTNTFLKQQGFTVTPNPFTDQVLVTFLEPPADLDAIAIYNTLGQLVARQQGSAINASNRFTFDLVNEPNGVYFVKLIYRNSTKTVKILKVR
ncbi:MAG TPA: M43 family zinc metalloprotease [Chitinophaga sp.]|uniref:M43 family zinc metalloprotease n=1 Tax=Chitinophaga sp. TaxID=1869181 RepID=UPI002DBDA680|nr:M43 family zinc metalloprotease [Chitinophaga sp.]HEU4553503.1 M43 family zinc metalloprotease [Chitinophaga sp.]